MLVVVAPSRRKYFISRIWNLYLNNVQRRSNTYTDCVHRHRRAHDGIGFSLFGLECLGMGIHQFDQFIKDSLKSLDLISGQ